MKFRHVCLEAIGYILPAEVITSESLENQLAAVYDRLHLPAGRLELMTGIQERRFFPPGSKPGPISALATQIAVEASGIPRHKFGVLVHGSVCRDQMEPATANLVHHQAGLPHNTLVFDVSNACLGLLNGALLLAQLIEAGQIQAGVVVGAELGRDLVEGTIDSLLNDSQLTRQSFKPAFASLTIGSAAAALVLCDRRISQRGTRFSGSIWANNTAAHLLCAGGTQPGHSSDNRPRMETDSEALLAAGIDLARSTWHDFLKEFDSHPEDFPKVFTHQVGKAHRKLLLEGLGLPDDADFPVHQYFGNTGSVALPLSLARGAEAGHVPAGARVGLLGIGSGLNCLMQAIEWQNIAVQHVIWK